MQELQSACQFSPNSKHPMEQEYCGRPTPYWLGAAQLEVGSSWPVGLQSSLPPLETTHGTWTYTNGSGLITCNCYLLCCFCCCEQWYWSDLSRVQAWTKCMEIVGCPVSRIPLLASPMWPKGEQSSTFGIDLAAGAAGRKSKSTTNLGVPLLVFPWGLLLKPFPWLDVATRQWRFEIRGFLLLGFPG